MKRSTMVLVLLALMATPALATHFNSLEAIVDCEGFEAYANIQFSTGITTNTMEYLVVVTDGDGAEVTSVGDTVTIECSAGGTCDFVFTGLFEPALDGGTFNVAGVFTVISAWGEPSASFETTVICGDDPDPEWCPRTPGYWKNHAENWPVDTLTVGGVELTMDEALAIFNAPVRGDATVILAYHLMAAMLNVAMGGGDAVADAIDDGNAFLVDHPVFSRPANPAKQEGLDIKNILADWNETECDDDDDDDDNDKSMAEEGMSWSSVKGLFR